MIKVSHFSVALCFLITDEGSSEVRRRTFAQLYADVSDLAAAMKSAGIQSGDVVVGQSAFLTFSHSLCGSDAFSALTLLAGHRKVHVACEKLSDEALA